MGTDVKIVADSISPAGKRITTMVLRYPRFIHAEFMTHRMFSRNAASSRAIPVAKMLEMVKTDPAMPVYWGKNKPGMQASSELEGTELALAKQKWLMARDAALYYATLMDALGLHKQITNRVLEPWMYMTVIVTATEWANFFALRRHPDAQPEIKELADMMWDIYSVSSPRYLRRLSDLTEVAGEYVRVESFEWHLPFVTEEERQQLPLDTQKRVSAARCARVSYLNHDGSKPDIAKDLALFEKLAQAPHASPFEHQATPLQDPMERSGNFVGYHQFRKELANENTTTYTG
jgi:hypothetical protein